jgi:hypothetical protein
VNNEFDRMWKGAMVLRIKIIIPVFPGGTETPQKPQSVRISNLRLPQIKQEHETLAAHVWCSGLETPYIMHYFIQQVR